MIEFNELKTRSDLAYFLQMPLKKLTYILYVNKIEHYYKSFDILKRNGENRHINAPTGDLKHIQRTLSTILCEFQKEIVKKNKNSVNLSHGFEKGKGIITNGNVHRNKRFVLNLDLEDFFDSIHFGRVRGYFEKNRNFELSREMATVIAQLTCYEGRLPQGAPSSPVITNLICNILDIHLLNICRKFKVDYTRYADDLTFSTNDKYFAKNQDDFHKEIETEIEKSGFSINHRKTRLLYRDARQEVTGLIVNEKLNVNREFYKATRAMAENLYVNGEFFINGAKGNINQLEGRFAYINQLDKYNNKQNNNKRNFKSLNSRETQYQKFIFYKYLFVNSTPLVITEGKTDVLYIKAALKKYHKDYPMLIEKKGDIFQYKISFLNRKKRERYFLGISMDGADTIKNIYDFCTGKDKKPNYLKYFIKKCQMNPANPIILVYDNEQETTKPLKKFIDYIGLKDKGLLKEKQYTKVDTHLYLLTNPLVKEMPECEIEDLFENSVLAHINNGKKFSREKDYDKEKFYGKSIFANHISRNYKKINFNEFKPMLDGINSIVENYVESELPIEP